MPIVVLKTTTARMITVLGQSCRYVVNAAAARSRRIIGSRS